MRTPNVFLAYAPRGAGLRCALAYLASERDVYGWFTGPRQDASVGSCFFLLEDFYTPRKTRYEAVDQAELHSAWSLDEARRHELEAYAEAELAAGDVNLRFERLDKLSKEQPNWTFYSPGFERPVLRQLAKRWPLEFRMHSELAAAPARRVVRSCP